VSGQYEYACFICPDQKVRNIGDNCPQCGRPIETCSVLAGQKVSGFTLRRYLGRGFYSAVFEAENRIGVKSAIKLIPKALYDRYDKDWGREVINYRNLGEHPNIAELRDAGGPLLLEFSGQKVRFYYMVTRYVQNAITLSEFVEKENLTVELCVKFVMEICAVITILQDNEFWHNDLHSRNVLVADSKEPVAEDPSRQEGYKIVIVDFGSLVVRNPDSAKQLGDMQRVGQHIRLMLDAILKRLDELTKAEQYFTVKMNEILPNFMESDPGRRIPAADAVNAVMAIKRHASRLGQSEPITLPNLDSHSNANSFPHEAYFSELLVDPFDWRGLISEPETTIISGPRGSGKTMLLRDMRLLTRFSAYPSDEPAERSRKLREGLADDAFIGLYVSGARDFSSFTGFDRLSDWLTDERLVRGYVNLLYAKEAIEAYLYLRDPEIIARSKEFETGIIDLCKIIFAREGIFAVATLEEMLICIDKEISHITQRQTRGTDLNDEGVGSIFLEKLTQLLTSTIKEFQTKHVFYLFDDFSYRNIPLPVQQCLVPLVFQTGHSRVVFKITTEMKSIQFLDTRGERHDASRHAKIIDLGRLYIESFNNVNAAEGVRFLEELFAKRGRLLPGVDQSNPRDQFSVANLLGTANGRRSVAREYLLLKRAGKAEEFRIYGIENLARLCSGDLHSIIEIVGRMIRRDPLRPVPCYLQQGHSASADRCAKIHYLEV